MMVTTVATTVVSMTRVDTSQLVPVAALVKGMGTMGDKSAERVACTVLELCILAVGEDTFETP